MARRTMWMLIAAALLVPAAPAGAAIDSPFEARISVNAPGDVTIAANTLQTCPVADAACAASQAGGNANNNAFAMRQVDVDADPTTSNSSRATLALPAGATVLYAGLYWGARTSAGGGGGAPAPDAARRAQVRIAPPGGAYQAVGGTVADSSVAGAYAGRADVTGLVAAGGAGTWTVADVQAGTGLDRYAGWALVVAYRDAAQPVRNLTIFDGLATLQQNPASERSVAFPVSGFVTPRSGPVRSTIGLVAYEGDRGSAGDGVSVNGTPLSDGANPANNVFNSTITNRGAPVPGRDPGYDNQLGFDADLLPADGILPNGATSLTLAETTNVEQFITQVVAVATELFAPQLRAAKRVELVGRSGDRIVPGDRVRFVVDVTNDGQDEARDVTVADPLPAGLTATSPSSVALGALAPGATATAAFEATVDAGTAGRTLENVAGVTGTGATSGVAVSTTAAASLAVVAAPPLPVTVQTTVTPSAPTADDDLTSTTAVTNAGPAPLEGVITTLTVTGPVEDVRATPSQGTCTVAGSTVTCALGTLAPGATATVRLRVTPASAGAVSVASTTTAPGYAAAVSPAVVRRVAAPRRLRLTKTASRRIARPGTTVTWTLRASVPRGAATARSVRVCDPLPKALRRVGRRATCTRLGTIRAGATKRLRVRTVVAARTRGRVVNRATARAAGLRARSARASVRVIPRTAAPCARTAGGVPARAAC